MKVFTQGLGFSALLPILLGFSACAPLMSELRYQINYLDVEESHQASQALGYQTDTRHYREALNLWPWINGGHLQRRALILSLVETKKPKKQARILDKLKSLDQSPKNRGDFLIREELKIISELSSTPNPRG